MERRHERVLLILSVVSLACVVASWVLLLWKIPYTENTIYLHYNVFFGVDLTGSWYQLLWLPGSGTAIWLFNTAVLHLDKKMDHITKLSVSSVTLAMEIMLIVASVLVILLNTD